MSLKTLCTITLLHFSCTKSLRLHSALWYCFSFLLQNGTDYTLCSYITSFSKKHKKKSETLNPIFEQKYKRKLKNEGLWHPRGRLLELWSAFKPCPPLILIISSSGDHPVLTLLQKTQKMDKNSKKFQHFERSGTRAPTIFASSSGEHTLEIPPPHAHSQIVL